MSLAWDAEEWGRDAAALVMAAAMEHLPCTCDQPHLGCHVHGPQPRERAVLCVWCMRTETFALDLTCDGCRQVREEAKRCAPSPSTDRPEFPWDDAMSVTANGAPIGNARCPDCHLYLRHCDC